MITNPKHVHKHYFVQTKHEFIPIEGTDDDYHRVEYAYLMCNSPCNDVKKVEVRKVVSGE